MFALLLSPSAAFQARAEPAPAPAAPISAETLKAAAAAAMAKPAQTQEASAPIEDADAKPLTPQQRAEAIKAGRKLAKERCSSCHAINAKGASANKAAPPFRTFASKWPLQDLEEPLAEGIVTGHEEMPEFVFTPDEITSFLEFLRSFKKAGK